MKLLNKSFLDVITYGSENKERVKKE